MGRLTLVLGAVGALVLDAAGATVPDKYLETIKVTDNVYVFKPKIDWTHGNGVAIIGPDGVFFIDTYLQYNYAEEAIRRLRKITRLPVRYIFNTHSHNDHTFGNGVFKRLFPQSRIIVQAAAVAPMEKRVREETAGQPESIRSAIALADSEIQNGRTGETPITGSMVPYWRLSLQEAREYQQQYHSEKYYSPDITFSDSLTMRWGELTLQMIHMTEDGHSRSDAILWIPEKRLLVAGDLVVAPTPYYSLPGITKAVQHLIAMEPSIIVPGHGEVEYDLNYLRLLERAFSTYQQAAQKAFDSGMSLQDARRSIAFPEIDREFTGDDDMKKFTYRAFVTNNIFARTWKPPTPAPRPTG